MRTHEPTPAVFADPHQFGRAFAEIMAGGYALCVGTLYVIQVTLELDMSVLQRTLFAVVASASVAYALAWLGYRNGTSKILLGPTCLELRQRRAVVKIAPAQVQGLVGLAGISLDGGEMIVWKKLVLLTEDHAFHLSFSSEENAACYKILRSLCPGAWGLAFPGKLQRPLADRDEGAREAAKSTLSRVRHYIVSKMIKDFFLGAALALGALAVGATLVALIGFAEEIIDLYLASIIWFVVGILLLEHGQRQFGVLQKIRRAKQAIQEEYD